MAKHQILLLVWRRKLLFAIVSFLVFSGIAITVLMWPRSYTATTKILLDAKSHNISTQVDILESSKVAAKVVELLQVKENPKAQERFKRERFGDETFEQFYTDRLKRSLTISPSKDGNVIGVSYRAADPAFAAQAANTIAKAYVIVSQELDLLLSQNKQPSGIPSANAVILDEAATPHSPSSPKTVLGFIAAIILAPIMGLTAVLFNEALDRRVRNRFDLEEATGVSVLCVVGMGRRSRTVAVLQTVFGFLLPSTKQRPY
jgi:uncharacterized protein involved in exopolysaccharide biosynthesis